MSVKFNVNIRIFDKDGDTQYTAGTEAPGRVIPLTLLAIEHLARIAFRYGCDLDTVKNIVGAVNGVEEMIPPNS